RYPLRVALWYAEGYIASVTFITPHAVQYGYDTPRHAVSSSEYMRGGRRHDRGHYIDDETPDGLFLGKRLQRVAAYAYGRGATDQPEGEPQRSGVRAVAHARSLGPLQAGHRNAGPPGHPGRQA